MRHAKTLGALILSILMFSMVLASVASAGEAEFLTAGNATSKDNGTATFESESGGVAVKCTSSEGTVTAQSNAHATFDELFLGCTAGGFKCTGAKDATSGSILVKGAILLVDIKVGTELMAVEVFILEEVEFTCLGIVTKVKGDVVGKVDNLAGEKTTKILVLLIGSKGKQEITTVNGELVSPLLESTGGGAFTKASQNQNVTATGPEVEVMY